MSNILNSEHRLPLVTQELLDYLRRIFPLEGFKEVRSEGDLRHLQGKHEVIDHLETLLRR